MDIIYFMLYWHQVAQQKHLTLSGCSSLLLHVTYVHVTVGERSGQVRGIETITVQF